MENASRALLIAGEVLIALLVIGLILYGLNVTGKFSKTMYGKVDVSAEDNAFNQNYYQYSGRINISADEVATAFNYAMHNNDKIEMKNDAKVNSDDFMEVIVEGAEGGRIKLSDIYKAYDKDEFPDKYNATIMAFIEQNNSKFFEVNVKSVKVEDSTKLTVVKNDKGILHGDIAIDGKTSRINQITFHVANSSNVGNLPADFGPSTTNKYQLYGNG